MNDIKLWFVRRGSTSDPQPSSSTAWAYVGSANLSESAWGILANDAVTKKPKFICRNWECGVIIPMRARQTRTNPDLDLTTLENSLAVFEGVVPVPMKHPGDEYGKNIPWFSMEQ